MTQSKTIETKWVARLTIGSILLGAAIVLLAGGTIATATEAQLVKIEPVMEGDKVASFKLDPQTVTVKKGTIVIWLNGVDKLVKVVFNDPAACQDVTADPTFRRFLTHWHDCYTTTSLPFQDATSLQLTQAKNFPYTVQTEDGKMMTKGTITVEP